MKLYKEPEWSEESTDIYPYKCQNSLHQDRSPTAITGFVIQWIRSLFLSRDNISNPLLKAYTWDKDSTKSRLKIESSTKWDPKNEGQHPAVFVKRGQFSYQGTAMNNSQHVLHFEEDKTQRGISNTKIINGGNQIFCIGDTELESDAIAMEIADNLVRFSEVFKRVSRVGSIQIRQVSDAKYNGEEGKACWTTVVDIAWHYVYNWTMYQNAPILKEVQITQTL